MQKSDCYIFKKTYHPEEYYLIVEKSEVNKTWIKIKDLSLLSNKKKILRFTIIGFFDINEINIRETIKKKGENYLLAFINNIL